MGRVNWRLSAGYSCACSRDCCAERAAHARTRKALGVAVTALKCIAPPGSHIAKNAEEEIAERALKAIAAIRRGKGR